MGRKRYSHKCFAGEKSKSAAINPGGAAARGWLRVQLPASLPIDSGLRCERLYSCRDKRVSVTGPAQRFMKAQFTKGIMSNHHRFSLQRQYEPARPPTTDVRGTMESIATSFLLLPTLLYYCPSPSSSSSNNRWMAYENFGAIGQDTALSQDKRRNVLNVEWASVSTTHR